MAVYFKFKSAKDFDSVAIEGHFISVISLKEKIVEQKKLGRGSDYDLVISNAQTNEEYIDEGFMVPKNTSVIVRRVPGRPSMTIIADVRDERKASVDLPPVNSGNQAVESAQKNPLQSTGPDGLDDFGMDLYAVAEVVHTPTLADDEDSKIKAFVDASASDWQRQTQEGFGGGRGYGNKGQGRGLPLRGGGGYGRGGFEKKNPPHGYVCHRCGVTGHYIQHCPTNGDPTYDVKKVKPPTGIPKTMLVANPDGLYALPSGESAVLRPNEGDLERGVEGMPTVSRPILDIPPDLCCPLCKGVLKEAVLTSKCCFRSFCDSCIRTEIISKSKCICGATNVLADDLLPNRTLRDAITRFLESQASGAATSSGNIGSRAQLPDMESAPYARPPKSASLKAASSTLVESDGSGTYESLAGGNDDVPSKVSASAKRSAEVWDASEFRPERPASSLPVARSVEGVDASPESQLTKDTVQEMARAQRPAKADQELRDGGPPLSEPVRVLSAGPPAKKRTKGKRARPVDTAFSEGMWNQGPNHFNPQMQAQSYCMHCGSYDHPSWNCHPMNGGMNVGMNGGMNMGMSHHPHAPMFDGGFNPPMMGMMHQQMGDGYVPYSHHPVPYNYGGPPPYEFPFNGPMGPPHEAFGPPHAGMMPYGHPGPRDFVHPSILERDEYEAKQAEMKRRREREQRFARDVGNFSSLDADIGSTRLKGRVGPRLTTPSERDREMNVDLPDERNSEVRSRRDGERLRRSLSGISGPREDWNDKEVEGSSDEEASGRRHYDMGKAHERWSSRRDEEASSEEDVPVDGRYSREEVAYSTQQEVRTHPSKTNGRSGQEGARSGQKRSVSGYDSEEDGDRRRQSGTQVGPSSPYRGFRNTDSDDLPLREAEHNANDESDTFRDAKALAPRERPRGSVFDRTNLPIKPRRTVENDYDAGNDREFRAKRIKGASGRSVDSREHVSRDSDDNSRQRYTKDSRRSFH